jgi:hypothetical protein
MLTVVAMLGIVSAGAFAQEQKPQKPDRPVIVEKPKNNPPPDNRDRNNDPKKGNDEKKKP